MILASEARRKADEIANKQVQQEWDKIDKLIEDAVSKGQYEVSISTITDTNHARIIDFGYNVKYRQCGPNETCYDISWRNA